MRIKSLISLVAIAFVLMVAISPLTARNTPWTENIKDNSAHPWQDDNQYVEPDDFVRINVPIGPIVISINVPVKWFGILTSKSHNVTSTTKTTVETARPMSLDKKGDIR